MSKPSRQDPVAAALQSIGRLEPFVLTHLINPAFMGGPRWPGLRQAFEVIRRTQRLGAKQRKHTLVASHGLSDPFDDGSGQAGFGLEFIAEVDEDVPFDDVKDH